MIEQYVKATQSSNLRDSSSKNPTDILKAVAFSGQLLGSTLIRLKACNDATVFHRVLISLETRLERRNQPITYAKQALMYWIADTCPACYGRGKQIIPDTPVNSDTDCQHCHGIGKRPQPPNVSKIVEMLEDIYRNALYSSKKRLDNY